MKKSINFKKLKKRFEDAYREVLSESFIGTVDDRDFITSHVCNCMRHHIAYDLCNDALARRECPNGEMLGLIEEEYNNSFIFVIYLKKNFDFIKMRIDLCKKKKDKNQETLLVICFKK